MPGHTQHVGLSTGELHMDIVRNTDGTLVVPVAHARVHEEDETTDGAPLEDGTLLLHPGEGGYDEALAEWDLQQNPDRAPAVSTASGREEAMNVVHTLAESPNHD